jgi:hypothetical protein
MNFVAEQNSRKECISFCFFLSSDVFLISLQGEWIHTKKKQEQREQGTPFDENIF